MVRSNRCISYYQHCNQINPYKPPTDKRLVNNLLDTLNTNDAVKRTKNNNYNPKIPQADVDLHGQTNIEGKGFLPRGIKYNSYTNLPFRYQNYQTYNYDQQHCEEHPTVKANVAQRNVLPTLVNRFRDHLEIRKQVKNLYPTKDDIPNNSPCAACMATNIQDFKLRA